MGKYKIVIGTQGFEVLERRKCIRSIAWSEIKEIIGYKKDLFCFDTVVFGFRTTEEDAYFTVFEEIEGCYELERALVANLELFDREWRDKILLPAFVLDV